MDRRIGVLVRDGKTIYYVVLEGGRVFEHSDLEAVRFQLSVADRA